MIDPNDGNDEGDHVATMTTLDDRTMFTTDPEFYTDKESCEGVPSFILMQAFEEARRVYYRCGGHNLAYRMELAIYALNMTLHKRGIEPEYTAKDVVNVDHWSVDWVKP